MNKKITDLALAGKCGGFAANGYGAHSPGGYSLPAALVAETARGYQCEVMIEGPRRTVNGKSILEVGGEAAEDIWVDDHEQLDFLGRVQLSRKISLVLELINLTDEPYRVYEGTPDRPIQEEYYSWWGILGLRFDL